LLGDVFLINYMTFESTQQTVGVFGRNAYHSALQPIVVELVL